MRALVLSGGSLSGAWQAGVLEHLICKKKRDYDIITGVSVGAIAAAYISQGKKGTEEIVAYAKKYSETWEKFSSSKDLFVKRNCFGVFWHKSLYDNSNLRKLLKSSIDQEKLCLSQRKVIIGTTALRTGRYCQFEPEHPDFIEAVIASTSITGIFPPVQLEEDWHIDGGARNPIPIKEALDHALKFQEESIEIDLVLCLSDNLPISTKNLDSEVQRLLRSVDILINEVWCGDIPTALHALHHAKHPHPITLNVYQPSKTPVRNPVEASKAELQYAVELGYKQAMRPSASYSF